MPFYFKSRRKPNYAKSNKKAKYLRKRQAANVANSRSLYTKYHAPRALSQTTEYPIRRMYSPTAVQAGASWADGLLSFKIADLPDYTELTALYDQYRVDKLVVHFISSGNAIASVGAQDIGTLLTAVDFDGGATGLTFNQFLSYESCEVTSHGRDKIITIKPKAELAAIDVTPVNTSSALPAGNVWWDCSITGIQHHGVRYGLTPYATGYSEYAIWYTLWVEAFVTFKNTR